MLPTALTAAKRVTGILECMKKESASSLFSHSVLSNIYILNLEKSALADWLVNNLDLGNLVRAVLSTADTVHS